MIGPAYQQAVVRAVLGDGHAPTIPDTLLLGFVDADGQESPQPRVPIANTSAMWSVDGPAVHNATVIDVGAAVPGWPAVTRWVLFDDADRPVVSGDLDEPVTPVEGAPVSVPVGGLRVEVG